MLEDYQRYALETNDKGTGYASQSNICNTSQIITQCPTFNGNRVESTFDHDPNAELLYNFPSRDRKFCSFGERMRKKEEQWRDFLTV
jgi:hypothetical protein